MSTTITTHTEASIRATIRKILTEQGIIGSSEVVPMTGYIAAPPAGQENKGLAMDSLDHVEVIMAIEDEYDIEIADSDADKLTTVHDLVLYLCNKHGVLMTEGDSL